MRSIEIIDLIKKLTIEQKPEVIQTRRFIHQFPELSFNEKQTSDYIYDFLQNIPEIIVKRPTPTSVLAILKGGKKGKVLAVRSDIDAIAIQEESQVSYSSHNPGIMHACGHDGHIAMLLGAVKILAKVQSEIKGEIRFIFQHAEEEHPGGARELVAQGVLEDVDMILAVHLWAALEVGMIGLTAGPLMAAPDNFNIEIRGKGGHAAMPHEVIDPILVSAQVITSLQAIVSRMNNALEPIVLSVTRIQGGTTYNVIPEKVELQGTVRTFNPELRKTVQVKMKNLLQGICTAFGASFVFDYRLGYDPVINDEDIIKGIAEVLRRTIGNEAIENVKPVMGGEDFSTYLRDVPGAMLFIGAGNKAEGIIYPHHHPKFNIDEKSLENGLLVIVLSSLGLLDVI